MTWIRRQNGSFEVKAVRKEAIIYNTRIIDMR
jgi:hypothetical protein